MEVKFLDLKKINARHQVDFDQSFREFIDGGYYILGSQTKKFELAFAEYCQSKYCLGVANGLDALILIFKALIQQKKLNVGDLVAVQGNTFIASALGATHCGLKIQVLTPTEGYNLSALDVEKQISKDAKCLLLVHLYGEMKDTDLIFDICKKKNIILVEDAAQAHGAMWNGKKAGQYGVATGFSFYPGKNLGALGDGGAIVTNDDSLFEELSYLRNYGSKVKYHHDRLGFNSRLDEIQAGFLHAKLKTLEQDNERRRAIAKKYNEGIKNPKVQPEVPSKQPMAHVHHLFLINTIHRDEFQKYLKDHGVDTLIHYPFAIFEAKPLVEHIVGDYKYDVERLNRNIISIPIAPIMTDAEVDYVISVINKF
jgi:dTDP-4-amino-4,6-dideoxygalactose transaminase